MAGPTTIFQTGVHASRPANGAGCVLYSCTTHSLIYRDDGASWTTYATLTGTGYTPGGTDVAVADGGTGASTAAGAATNLGLGTGDSPQFTAVNVGHASDTTLARSGAGELTVEGNRIFRVGGADVPIADGGTGSSTATAAFDALSPMTTAGDIIVGGASGTRTRLAIGATSGMVLGNSGGSNAYFLPPGYEFDYVQKTSSTNITATSAAAANTILTGNAVTYDGTTPVMFEFCSLSVYLPQANASITFCLYDGSSSVGQFGALYANVGATDIAFVISGAFARLTPSAAAHTYSVRAFVGGAYTASVAGGAGGSGNSFPAFFRQYKAA